MLPLKTPVVFIIFNRPDLAELVFREIARARPAKLLVIADGPRPFRAGEAERCAATRKLVESVDWECEVLTHYSDTNLGCKERVSSGITWAFTQVEEAIILEDDVVPDASFFQFCEEMLGRYRHDPKIMMIAGTSFLGSNAPTNRSYYFSHFALIWGWATWRRAWSQYDITMKDWGAVRESSAFRALFQGAIPFYHYRRQLDLTASGRLETWDLQWSLTVWRASGYCVNPTRNLIRNIGFGPEATHTHFYDPAFDPPVIPMNFPLVHTELEESSVVGDQLDGIWLRRHYGIRAKILRRVVGYLKRWRDQMKAVTP